MLAFVYYTWIRHGLYKLQFVHVDFPHGNPRFSFQFVHLVFCPLFPAFLSPRFHHVFTTFSPRVSSPQKSAGGSAALPGAADGAALQSHCEAGEDGGGAGGADLKTKKLRSRGRTRQ